VKKKSISISQEPVVVGYWDGKGGTPPASDDEEYMHGWYNGDFDAALSRGEMDHVILKTS